MVLHTNFNNWYHPLVNLGDPDFDNSYNLQYQQDLARIYEMGDVQASRNQIELFMM